jgi:hypothetical protein
MIIVRLCGGLGNQMFQYAAGRRLALRTGSELKLDLTPLDRSRERSYGLHVLPIRATRASSAEIRHLTLVPKPLRLVRRLFRRPVRPASHFREPDLRFHPEILDLSDGVYLDGYWQSERYFADAADVIRIELAAPAPTSDRDREVAEWIDDCEAVSLHVRRGDYVTSKVARETLGPCAPDYYRRAAATLTERLDSPRLFVFSDEPEWARETLDLPLPMTVVDHNGPDDAHRDLALLARCRHHVIANSSFSWWGAWLSPNPSKIVIAPRRWFAREDLSADDLVPERWLRL